VNAKPGARACIAGRRPPAEADMQQYFRVTPPSVHQMVLTLEREGLIRRQPRTARSIELLVDLQHLPELL
jgi:DNA-binding MarR family transcriptional regulator